MIADFIFLVKFHEKDNRLLNLNWFYVNMSLLT